MAKSSTIRLVLATLLGQLLALMITGCGVFSKLLEERGFSFPTAQSSLNYIAIFIVYMPILVSSIRKMPEEERQKYVKGLIRTRSWRYALLGLADVEGNFLLVLSYQFTSITSVTLLDCSTLPTVMVLSYFLLKSRYNRLHIIGVALCVAGIALLVSTDTESSLSASNPLLGDLLVLAGATLYAISNVFQEKLVKDQSQIEWLAMIGLFGMIVSSIQAAVLENEIFKHPWTAQTIAFLLGFVACLFFLYSFVPKMFILSSATFYNMSLLTSDFYSAAASSFILKSPPSFWFYISFSIVALGLITYHYIDIVPKHFPHCGVPEKEEEAAELLSTPADEK